MTTFNEARDLLITTFETAWSGATPIAYDNEQFNPPENSAWVAFSIQPYDSDIASLRTPNQMFRRFVLASAQIYVPLNTATYTIDGYVKTIMDAFEGQLIGDIHIWRIEPNQLGKWDNGFFRTDVMMYCHFDEIKT